MYSEELSEKIESNKFIILVGVALLFVITGLFIFFFSKKPLEIKLSKPSLSPGDEEEIKLVVRNTCNKEEKNITVVLESVDKNAISVFPKVEPKIPVLGEGEERIVSFYLRVSSDALPGKYKLVGKVGLCGREEKAELYVEVR